MLKPRHVYPVALSEEHSVAQLIKQALEAARGIVEGASGSFDCKSACGMVGPLENYLRKAVLTEVKLVKRQTARSYWQGLYRLYERLHAALLTAIL